MKSLAVLLGLALSLSACVKVTDKEDENNGAQAGSALYEVRPLAEPSKYQVALQMHPETQVVQRSVENTNSEATVLPMNMQDGILTDTQPESGKTYIYEQGVVRDGHFEVLRRDKIRIPKDEIIQSEIVLTKDEVWKFDGRLYLEANGIITTNGFALAIETQRLVGKMGLIRTFPAGSQAAIGQKGQSGGAIRIIMRTGEGTLKVEMRGQRGGDGIPGADYTSAPPTGINIGGPGGMGFSRLIAGEGGGTGGNGLPGGDSGSFQIQSFEAHSLMILPLIECGSGGGGGRGGKGSPAVPHMGLDNGPEGLQGGSGPAGQCQASYIQDLNGQRAL